MKIDLRIEKREKGDSDYYFERIDNPTEKLDILVDNSFVPNNMYLINITDIKDLNKEKECDFYFIRKVQNFIVGHLEYKGIYFPVQAINIIRDNQLETFIIEGHSSSHFDYFVSSDIDYWQLDNGDYYLIDMDEIKINTLFKDKTITDIVDFLKKDRDNYDNICGKIKNKNNIIQEYISHIEEINNK